MHALSQCADPVSSNVPQEQPTLHTFAAPEVEVPQICQAFSSNPFAVSQL
jgi:hypothetical protein